tara:strand:- start:1793 stop:1984 length:192 start_codon:yes stop_codon:yes gene_type:complete
VLGLEVGSQKGMGLLVLPIYLRPVVALLVHSFVMADVITYVLAGLLMVYRNCMLMQQQQDKTR